MNSRSLSFDHYFTPQKYTYCDPTVSPSLPGARYIPPPTKLAHVSPENLSVPVSSQVPTERHGEPSSWNRGHRARGVHRSAGTRSPGPAPGSGGGGTELAGGEGGAGLDLPAGAFAREERWSPSPAHGRSRKSFPAGGVALGLGGPGGSACPPPPRHSLPPVEGMHPLLREGTAAPTDAVLCGVPAPGP